MEHETILW